MCLQINIADVGVHVVDAAGDFDGSCRCKRSRPFQSKNRRCSRGSQRSDTRILNGSQITIISLSFLQVLF